MQQSIHLLFAGVPFSTLLPVTVWGYGFNDYQGGSHYQNSLRLEKNMTEDGYYLRAYLEGLSPEDVQVYLRNNRLILKIAQGERRGRYNPGARGVSQWQMSFRRQLRLPYDADWTRMTKSTKNGIMEIYIPRRRQYMPTDPPLKQQ